MSWKTHHDAGGLPTTCVGHALQQLRLAMDQGSKVFVQQDVAAWPSSLTRWAMLRFLKCLYILKPRPFFLSCSRACAHVVPGFSALNSCWIHPTRGVAQGCPLSPLISATMAHVWASFVLRQGVDGFAFCDDRCLWTTPGSNIASLREALARASRFDRACGLELSSSKCAVISPLSHAPAAALAREVQYQHLDTLSILGVTATVDTSWGLLKFSLRKALLRLRLLRGLGVGRVDCTHILKSLTSRPFGRRPFTSSTTMRVGRLLPRSWSTKFWVGAWSPSLHWTEL